MYKTSIGNMQVIFKKDRKMSDDRFLQACSQLETLESLLDFEHERLILIKDALQNTIIVEKKNTQICTIYLHSYITNEEIIKLA
ncbi:hypothetical protein SLL00_18045 [Metabacillus indicus]|uniref:hypothetical protein n=1 Tax=Metabacillus TaxID=2675233 RepID=UPI002A05B93E|nr:hypothetical protein [Metabacillus indicus]MDX8291720.1 hypothetical protein [Metabacillus indicus]